MSLLHWIIALAGFELLSFVVFGLSIATAVPGEEMIEELAKRSVPGRIQSEPRPSRALAA